MKKKSFKTKEIILTGMLLSAGAILKFFVGSFINFGMKPNFIIAMYCLTILLLKPNFRVTIVIGITSGLICQLFPGQPLINLVSEFVGALVMTCLVKITFEKKFISKNFAENSQKNSQKNLQKNLIKNQNENSTKNKNEILSANSFENIKNKPNNFPNKKNENSNKKNKGDFFKRILLPIYSTFLTTLASGTTFIIVMYAMYFSSEEIKPTPLVIFVPIILGTAIINSVIVSFLYYPLKKILKFFN